MKNTKIKNKSSKKRVNKSSDLPIWNLGLLYKSTKDPQIEKDAQHFEKICDAFSMKYDTADKKYLVDETLLFQALADYESLNGDNSRRCILYFNYIKDTEASNETASAQLSLLSNRLTQAGNKTMFFEVSIGTISISRQKVLLESKKLARFKVFLQRIFSDAKHTLSVAEEKIMSLKSLPAYDMWLMANEKMLNQKTVVFKGKKLAVSEAMQTISKLESQNERQKLASAVCEVFKEVSSFSEAEINAIVTNKKINDELRNYKTPYENTVRTYRNEPVVVENLVKTVTAHNSTAHRFYKLKAKLLKLKYLNYADRAAKIGATSSSYSFTDSLELLKQTFGALNPKYREILTSYVANGQIDARPRPGKRGGAYCSSSYENPTFVLLNHTDDLDSFETFAHEMGHAFHGELSESQGPIYCNYSYALAETASTLFETIAIDKIMENLSDKEKSIVLHDRINRDISTIHRQIACFNFEWELHEQIRAKGFLSKEEIAVLHNKHMQAYLGPLFKLTLDDGYMFVQWSHLRRFFYVYSYAFGLLVTKALLRRYKQDPSFWTSIEKFLTAGGNDSPENILKSISIDVTKPDFWEEGLKEIEDDIVLLEKLTSKKKK